MRSSRSVAPRRARPDFSSQPYVAPRFHRNLWGRVVFAVLILGVVAVVGIGGGLYWSLHHQQSSSASPITVHVGSGDTVTTVADRLASEGVISNALLFRLDARLQDLAAKLKVGDYTLRRNMSIDQMIAALTVYHSRMISVSIPEGWRSEQIAARLSQHGINGKQFLYDVRHPDATTLGMPVLQGKPAGASLEGYLFPNTYKVPPHYSPRQFIRLMIATLQSSITPAMQQALSKQRWNMYRVLTLASIVEREAKVPDERPVIASVYINRLNSNMGLFADPTVQYAVGTPQNWWPVLNLDPHTVKSPYNTYTHMGLPPGPIANAGLASIKAVIYPRKTGYFYFVAEGNGRHAFARTYQEQLQNQQRYQH